MGFGLKWRSSTRQTFFFFFSSLPLLHLGGGLMQEYGFPPFFFFPPCCRFWIFLWLIMLAPLYHDSSLCDNPETETAFAPKTRWSEAPMWLMHLLQSPTQEGQCYDRLKDWCFPCAAAAAGISSGLWTDVWIFQLAGHSQLADTLDLWLPCLSFAFFVSCHVTLHCRWLIHNRNAINRCVGVKNCAHQ